MALFLWLLALLNPYQVGIPTHTGALASSGALATCGTVVQHTSAATASGASISVAFPSNLGASHFMAVWGSAPAGDVIAPSDTLGSTWTRTTLFSDGVTTFEEVGLWTAPTGSGGADTVQIGDSTTSTNELHVIVYELSGGCTAYDARGTNVDTGTTSLSASTSGATTVNDEGVFGFFMDTNENAGFTAGSGFGNTETSNAGFTAFVEFKSITSTGTQTATATAGTADNFIEIVDTYR